MKVLSGVMICIENLLSSVPNSITSPKLWWCDPQNLKEIPTWSDWSVEKSKGLHFLSNQKQKRAGLATKNLKLPSTALTTVWELFEPRDVAFGPYNMPYGRKRTCWHQWVEGDFREIFSAGCWSVSFCFFRFWIWIWLTASSYPMVQTWLTRIKSVYMPESWEWKRMKAPWWPHNMHSSLFFNLHLRCSLPNGARRKEYDIMLEILRLCLFSIEIQSVPISRLDRRA